MKKIQHYIVVDDDPTNNMICEFTIKRYDKESNISLYTEPEEALSSIQESYGNSSEKLATVLFLDVNMPTMTGWEFLDKFILLEESIKSQFDIYILSSSIEDFEEEAALYPILNGFLSKPLKLEHLQNLMDELHSMKS